MVDDGPHKQEFQIRDLTTRTVILFPTRAQIIRDVKEIALHPGPNQIVIDGLAPTVDEHSIKVEGTGAATITDVTVDLLPNREAFEDIYPSDSEDDDESEDEKSDDEDPGMVSINEKIKELNLQVVKEQETIHSAAYRLQICDDYGRSVQSKPPATHDLEKLIEAYKDERGKIYQDHEVATAAMEKVQEAIAKAEKERAKIAKSLVKANEKAEKQKAKERQKRLRKRAEIAKEKARVKAERESFWPKKVYRVTINLEPTSFTPGSSRRSSIDGDTVVNLATTTFHETPSSPLKVGEISLSLSYLTYSASWSPRYDMNLNSVKSTGLLEYGAELRNTTSETWTNAKVILSTSQTTSGGLSDTIPTLLPWHVRLFKNAARSMNAENALFSAAELAAKREQWSNTSGAEQSQKPRHEMFGKDNSEREKLLQQSAQQEQAKKQQRAVAQSQYLTQHSAPPQASFGTIQVNSAAALGNYQMSLMSLEQQNKSRKMMSRQQQGGMPSSSRRGGNQYLDVQAECEGDELASLNYEIGGGGNSRGFDFGTPGAPAPQSLSFEEGAWEESGMTTTYDVPGTKTLGPSNSTIKHKIAKIDFRNIIFSHIVIGKLRQVAFLKARLRNASKITLLKGPMGLTLDGSFLGQATFPRCSAGESFSLPLGIDPSITVSYPKPTVQRSQTGIFTKEDSNVFTRTISILNTKHGNGVEITVLDQVPVSEDERLKIEVLTPRGLKVGGEKTLTGTGLVDGREVRTIRASASGVEGRGDPKSGWGNALAEMKKGGEVTWNVKLNPGKGVKLALEYQATFPGGETVIGV